MKLSLGTVGKKTFFVTDGEKAFFGFFNQLDINLFSVLKFNNIKHLTEKPRDDHIVKKLIVIIHPIKETFHSTFGIIKNISN